MAERYTVIANVPVPPTSVDWNKIQPLAADLQTVNNASFDPAILQAHSANWVPELSGWDLGYDDEGASSCTQTWIAPFVLTDAAPGNYTSLPAGFAYTLPLAIRQLVSWNREKYAKYATFFDGNFNSNYNFTTPASGTSIGFNQSQPLVPVRVRLTPRSDLMDQVFEKDFTSEGGTTLVPMSAIKDAETAWDDPVTGNLVDTGDYPSSIREKLRVYSSAPGSGNPEIKGVRPVFPRMRSQYYTVSIEFARDRFKNRFGIRYAQVELRPSVRLLSLKNLPMALVPTGFNGQPDFTALYQVEGLVPPGGLIATPTQTTGQAQVTEAILEKIDTGFPVREGQIEIRITHPWVSMEQLLAAGPIGNLGQLDAAVDGVVKPFTVPDGLYLGAVNSKSFLGYSRGRVLYNGCELTPKQSPVSGKLGFQVTNEYLVNPNMEWNQARYSGTYNPTDPNNPAWQIPGNAIAARTGYMCLQPSRTRQEGKDAQNMIQFTYAPIYTVKLAHDNAYHAIYPYPYMDFNALPDGKPALLYYGMTGDNNCPTTEG